MLAYILSAVILALFLLWCHRFVFQGLVNASGWLVRGWIMIQLLLMSWLTVLLFSFTFETYHESTSKPGKTIETVIVREANDIKTDDPYSGVQSNPSEDGGLDLTIIKPDQIKVNFDAVAGLDGAKQEVKEIVDFMKNPGRYTELGATMPRGVLLYGPPGTGKTLIARAVAGESGVTFIAVDGAGFDEMWVGVGAARVRELFNTARQHAPAIIFIDELDAVAPSRTAPGATMSGRIQTINQLLAEMDNVLEDKNKGIVVMGATNRLDSIDSALLRPGRFDRKVFIRLPNFEERKAIFQIYLDKVKLSKGIDLDSLAGTTYSFSGAEIKNLVNEATLHAARNNQKTVTQADFNHAIDKIKLGLEIKNALVSDEEKLLTAYHEAGHTLVGIMMPNYNLRFNKVTIGVRNETLGVTHFELQDDGYNMSRGSLEDQLAMLLAGKIAEEMAVGKDMVTTGASSDLSRATKIAQSMVMDWGLSNISDSIAFSSLDHYPVESVNNEIVRILDNAHDRAKDLLTKNRAKLDALAKALVKKEILTREEVMAIINKH